jgi:septal ring factor EnvC (AmiA/AmiB activator)
MSKGDPVPDNHNDIRVNRGLERGHTIIHDRVDQTGGWLRDRRHGSQSGARFIWKRSESVRDEGEQFLRKRHRCSGIDLAAATHDGTPQLDAEKRIATRGLMDAAHQRTRERNPQSRLDHLVQCAHTERPHRQAFYPDGIDCAVEVKRTRRPSLLQPPGEQERDRLVTQAAHSERERRCGSSVEPLHIIHSDKQRITREKTKHGEQRSVQSTRVRKRPLRLGEQESNLERPPLRRRQRRQRLGEHRSEQIDNSRKRELGLRRSRSRSDDLEAPRAGKIETRAPEHSLADPR